MKMTRGRLALAAIVVVGVVAVVAMLTGNAEVFFDFLTRVFSGGE